MVISIRSEPGASAEILSISGELDLATAPRVERELLASEARGPERTILDLRGVKFIDSTGLRLILAADQRARQGGRTLEIVRGPAHVQRLFGITGLETRLQFLDEIPEGDSV